MVTEEFCAACQHGRTAHHQDKHCTMACSCRKFRKTSVLGPRRRKTSNDAASSTAVRDAKPARPKPPPGDTPHWFTLVDDFLRWEAELLEKRLIPRQFDCDPFGHPEAPVTKLIAARPNAHVAIGLSLGARDGLALPWAGLVVWVNPGPYAASFLLSKVCPKMNQEAVEADGIVALLPNHRGRRWWTVQIAPGIENGSIIARDLPGRQRFGWPGLPEGHKRAVARFESALLAWHCAGPGAQPQELPPRGAAGLCLCGHTLGDHSIKNDHCKRCVCELFEPTPDGCSDPASEPRGECICRHAAHPGGPCTWTSGPPDYVTPVMCGCKKFELYRAVELPDRPSSLLDEPGPQAELEL